MHARRNIELTVSTLAGLLLVTACEITPQELDELAALADPVAVVDPARVADARARVLDSLAQEASSASLRARQLATAVDLSLVAVPGDGASDHVADDTTRSRRSLLAILRSEAGGVLPTFHSDASPEDQEEDRRFLRAFAVHSLGRLASPTLAPFLVSTLEGADPGAGESLLVACALDALVPLVDALDARPLLRRRLFRAMAQLEDLPSSVPRKERAEITRLVAWHGERAATLPALCDLVDAELLESRDTPTLLAALEWIHRLLRREALVGGTADSRAIGVLRTLALAPEASIAAHARSALAEIAPPELLELLIEELEREPSLATSRALALANLLERVGEPEVRGPTRRSALAIVLEASERASVEVREALLARLFVRDPSVLGAHLAGRLSRALVEGEAAVIQSARYLSRLLETQAVPDGRLVREIESCLAEHTLLASAPVRRLVRTTLVTRAPQLLVDIFQHAVLSTRDEPLESVRALLESWIVARVALESIGVETAEADCGVAARLFLRREIGLRRQLAAFLEPRCPDLLAVALARSLTDDLTRGDLPPLADVVLLGDVAVAAQGVFSSATRASVVEAFASLLLADDPELPFFAARYLVELDSSDARTALASYRSSPRGEWLRDLEEEP